jgi:NosR/NirI family nitrous oxide reductase transcriptional regulator
MLHRFWSVIWNTLKVVSTPIRVPFGVVYDHLHSRWPSGGVEKLPEIQANGRTNVPGLYVVGDLTGIPLLKFSADSGAQAIQHILQDAKFQRQRAENDPKIADVLIVGGGVSGMSAALEADRAGLRYELIESAEPFATVRNFPNRKPIFTYPSNMSPRGSMQITAKVKETLLEELQQQTLQRGIAPTCRGRVEKINRGNQCLEATVTDHTPYKARRVIVAIGRSGNFRKLEIPGEDLPKVSNRLFDPADYRGQRVMVVGGGDSAVESAVAIAEAGGSVDLCYRQAQLSRPKSDNLTRLKSLEGAQQAGSIRLHLNSTIEQITPTEVSLSGPQGPTSIANDAVLTMIGREAPLDFFRRSGVRIQGETRGLGWLPIAMFFLFIWFLYDWKNNGLTDGIPFVQNEIVQKSANGLLASLAEWWNLQVSDRTHWLGTLAVSMQSRSFYFTLLYTVCIGWFGIRRVLRRRTRYVTLQTSVLFMVQMFPLFLLPELILPWMGYNGAFESGWGQQFADGLFESYISPEQWAAQEWPDGYHPRAYWRAYGCILAFPLMIYNVLNTTPLGVWLWISAIQTFVIIPLIVWKWGKGSFCGWICSCGGLAETMGDAHRHKMFHGATSNRFNMVGQVILFLAFALLGLRIWGWVYEGGIVDTHFDQWVSKESWFSYLWVVDVAIGGVLGVGLYFKYSGRIWCRFACPLAALMHFYARFSKFRILSDKKKCISCNACTTNCHMGIDVMGFANKGVPLEDPECVRCSACVATCPTGVLEFGEVNRQGEVQRRSWLSASPVTQAETPDSRNS